MQAGPSLFRAVPKYGSSLIYGTLMDLCLVFLIDGVGAFRYQSCQPVG